MQKSLNIFLVILISLYSLSCEHKNDSGSDSFESLVIEYNFSENKYELNKKKIYSLDAPRDLNSGVAKFFYQVEANVNLDYEDAVELNLIKTSDELYVAKDLSSLKALSSYKIYEDYYNLHNKLGILSHSVWPKKVVVDGSNGDQERNAFHIPKYTSTFYLPFDPYDVPASLNPGIIAHEENHGLFYTQVIKNSISEDVYEKNMELLEFKHKTVYGRYQRYNFSPSEGVSSSADVINIMEYNQMLLRALNEGLADYSGFVFSKVPNFLTVTLGYESSEKRKFNRVVSNSLVEPLPSVIQLQAVIDNIKGEPNLSSASITREYLNQSKSMSALLSLSYSLAGQISSLLNILSQNIDYTNKPEDLSENEYFFKLVVESLNNLGSVLEKNYETKRISFDDFFKSILKEQVITGKICTILRDNVTEQLTLKACLNE